MTGNEAIESRRALLLLVLGLYLALTLPKLLTLGLFQDGVVFASVARNMAEGLGDFWTPRFTDTAYRLEFMHPPIGPWILSHFFGWFGDQPRLEVFYGIGLGLLNLGLLALLWRTVSRRSGAACGAWLPLFLYVAMPLTGHAYTSNLLECPMTSFLLLATVASHRAVEVRSRAAGLGLTVLSGLMIFLAIQTKGPAAAYVHVYPFLLALLVPGHRWQRGLAVSAGALGMALLITAAVILPSEAALEFTRQHYQGLVFQALEGGNIPSQGRFSVLKTMLAEPLAGLVLALIAARVLRVRPRADPARRDLLFLSTALAGSLPYLITTHQYSRYALPALVMLAVALAFFLQEVGARIESSLSRRGRSLVTSVAVLLAAVGVAASVTLAGSIRKHEEFHLDFSVQPLDLDGRPLVSVCPHELAVDWELVGDLQRYLSVSLTTEPGQAYWLTENGSGCEPPAGCSFLHPPESKRYRLFSCR
jgi:hypothetical protein